MFYLKKLCHQELGSITPGKGPQRGRYILISKGAINADFFPCLSSTTTNDNAILPIISLEFDKKVYCNLVYHNDRITKNKINGRNEYRLYLNSDIENNNLIFKEDDIVIFSKRKNEIEGEYQDIYFIKRYSASNDNYVYLDEFLTNNGKKNHLLYDGDLFELNDTIEKYNLLQAHTQISEDVVKQIKETEKRIEDLFNVAKFRDFVMTGYQRKCAITGISISYDQLFNLEAAHIKPRATGEINLPSNGIAMGRDMHWAFDKGFFTITDDYIIKVHENIKSDYLKQFDGKKIMVPDNDFFKPNKEFLQYHQNKIFGMFQYCGVIRER